MRNIKWLLIQVLVFLGLCSQAFAGLEAFSGKWENIDPNTSGITRIQIEVVESSVTVRAWGKCHPQDCEWGRVEAIPYATSPGDLISNTVALMAIYPEGFSQITVMIKPVSKGKLEAEVYTHFTDNCKRTDYVNAYTFARQNPVPLTQEQLNPAIPTGRPVAFELNSTTAPIVRSYEKDK